MAQGTSSLRSSEKAICEIWKPIKGFEEFYEISNYGRIRSLDRVIIQKGKFGQDTNHIYKGKIVKLFVYKDGYARVGLHKNGEMKTYSVHRLVGEHFLEKKPGKDCINHLDCNKANNNVNNLEWCTQSENIQYAYDNRTKIPPHQKKISQYDMAGNLIQVWESMAEAARSLGLQQSNISKVCLGKRSQTGGYKWAFTE